MIVIESELQYPRVKTLQGLDCLYVRRDMFPDDSYKEFYYFGSPKEVQALSARCVDLVFDSLLFNSIRVAL